MTLYECACRKAYLRWRNSPYGTRRQRYAEYVAATTAALKADISITKGEDSPLRPGDRWLVIDDQFYIAHETWRDGDKRRVTLYRNLSDYRANRHCAMGVPYNATKGERAA